MRAVAIAGRRSEWTTVILAGDDGFSALCSRRLPQVLRR